MSTTSLDGTVASVLAAIEANTAAVNQNNALLERVVAGQTEALAKIGDGKPATAARKPRQTAAEKAAAEAAGGDEQQQAAAEADVPSNFMLETASNNETVETEKGPSPTAAWRASDFSEAQVKGEFAGWISETTDPEARKERTDFVVAIAQHFGVKTPFGANGVQDDEQRKQLLFFLRRKREGVAVDFSADYDFEGDPLQGSDGAGEPAADEDDGIDALG